MTSPRRLFS